MTGSSGTESGVEGIASLDLASLAPEVAAFYGQIAQWGLSAPAVVRREYQEAASAGRIRSIIGDGVSVNAWAVQVQDGFVLGLFAALPAVLHFTSNHLLRCPMVLPRLGDASSEEPQRGGYRRGIPLTLPEGLSIPEASLALPGYSRPRCDRRAAAASALTEIACAFAIFHEVGHVIAGHAGHLAECSLLALLELSPSERTVPSSLRAVWEYEADKIAAIMLLSFLVDPSNAPYFCEVFELCSVGTGSVAELAAIGLMAACTVFLLLGQRSRALGGHGVHPHPIVRMAYVHNAIRICAGEDLTVAAEVFDEPCDAHTSSIFGAWRMIGAPIPALATRRIVPASCVVRVSIELLERRHCRLQSVYQRHSWLPATAWREAPG